MIPLSEKWRQVRQSFTHTPQAVRFVWRTNRWATVGLGLLTLGGALLQVKDVFFYLILELALFLLSAAFNHGRRLIQQLIQLQLANRIRAEIIRKALTLELAYFEDPDFYDRLQNARREGGS